MVRASRVCLSFLVLVGAAGCASQRPQLMRAVRLLDAMPAADQALVVFVRDSNPCDSGDPFRLVDEKGRFLGEVVASSKFAVRVAPGEHAFFVWQPHGDLPRDLYPEVNQVGVLEREFEVGKTYTIDVSILNAGHGLRGTCFAYQWLALHQVDPSSPDVFAMLSNAQPLAPNVAAGQAAIETAPRDVEEHVDLGMRKLAMPLDTRDVVPDVFGGKLGGRYAQ